MENVAMADALMRGIAEARVSDVSLIECHLAPASVPGLTRLLKVGCLERLCINNLDTVNLGLYCNNLFDAGPELTAFCHALRSSTLQELVLGEVELWEDLAASGELLAALVSHPTLRELSLPENFLRPATDVVRRAAGEQLASLITHTSTLQKLNLECSDLREAGLAPIFKALRHSSTLKELLYHMSYAGEDGGGYDYDVDIDRDFARDVILPAVLANTSLQKLHFSRYNAGELMPRPELLKAEAIVAKRTHTGAGGCVDGSYDDFGSDDDCEWGPEDDYY